MRRAVSPAGGTAGARGRTLWPRWMVLLGMLLGPGAAAPAQPPKPRGLPPAPVAVAQVQKRKMALGQRFVGTVKPLRVTTVGSPVADLVVDFKVNEGDRVEKGQPLAVLRTETLEIELRAAKAELQLRQQELAELINGSRPEEIWEAEAQLAAAGALMEYTSQRLARTQRLLQTNAATEEDLQEQTSAAKGAAETFEAKMAAWLLTLAGPRKEKIEQAWAQVAMQEATIRRLEDQQQLHTIRAPFAGHVTREFTEVGQWIAVGAPVVELVELSSVYVEVPVVETYIAKVRPGMKGIPVEASSMPDRKFQGTVDLVVPQADARSRSFPVKVRVDNNEVDGRPVLKPGMMAWVTLPVGDEAEVTAVPKDALVLGQGPPKVWVVVDPKADPPGPLRQVPVKLLRADDGWIGVEGELEAGQTVIVEGNERINPMQPIRIEDRSAGKPAGKR
jgi:HlyD family secretion protein